MTKKDTTMWVWNGPVFILQDVSLEHFCRKYELEPFNTYCKCGKTMSVDIPFRSPGRAGLCAKRCTCKIGKSRKGNTPFSVSMTHEQFDAGQSLLGF